jgi:hypothetical protein
MRQPLFFALIQYRRCLAWEFLHISDELKTTSYLKQKLVNVED